MTDDQNNQAVPMPEGDEVKPEMDQNADQATETTPEAPAEGEQA